MAMNCNKLILLLLFSSSLNLPAEAESLRVGDQGSGMGVSAGMDISLCGEWHFVADSADYSAGLPVEAILVNVPHTYNVMSGLEDYAGHAWYGKRLHIPTEMKGKKLRLQFEAVYHDATVYVNGRKVGSHVGKGYTPFSIDITSYVMFGQENLLVVEVDNSYSTYNFPYKRAFD